MRAPNMSNRTLISSSLYILDEVKANNILGEGPNDLSKLRDGR
jgi:hypothetical protein